MRKRKPTTKPLAARHTNRSEVAALVAEHSPRGPESVAEIEAKGL